MQYRAFERSRSLFFPIRHACRLPVFPKASTAFLQGRRARNLRPMDGPDRHMRAAFSRLSPSVLFVHRRR